MRSYWRKRFRDLQWRHIPIIASYDLYGFAGQQFCLIHCQIAFESWRTARFIMDVEKQVEIFTTGNTCLIWVVAWPWVQCHNSTTKDHRNSPLVDLMHKRIKGKYVQKKSDLYRKNCSMQPRKTVWGGTPGCGRGLMPADRACRWQWACTRGGPQNSCWFG